MRMNFTQKPLIFKPERMVMPPTAYPSRASTWTLRTTLLLITFFPECRSAKSPRSPP